MCGVVAISSHQGFVNQNLYDALLVLQHRGQMLQEFVLTQIINFLSVKALDLLEMFLEPET